MQLIDVNCMLGEWTYQKLRFKEPEGLICEMKRLDITKSFVLDIKSWRYDIHSGNAAIIETVRDYQDSLIPVISLTPLLDQEFGGRQALINFMKTNKVGAVRLFPMDHSYTLDLWSVDNLFSILDESHMLVLIEGRGIAGTIDPYYPQIYELAKRYGNVHFVLLSVGYRSLRTIYGLLEKCPNIHLDTSTFITYHGIEDVVKYYGSERILFGSRMPFIEGGVSTGRLIYADLETADKENIAFGNTNRLFRDNKHLFPDKEVFQVEK